MEKRRLLLVVMLLATSGAAFASEPSADKSDGTRGKTRKQKMSAAWKKARHPGGWFANTRARWSVSVSVASDEAADGHYVQAACDYTTAPFHAFMATTVGDLIPCFKNYYFLDSFNFGTGVALGVTGTVAYKAWKKRGEASDGVRKLFRKIRSFSFRKKALEKRTDGEKIEAEQA